MNELSELRTMLQAMANTQSYHTERLDILETKLDAVIEKLDLILDLIDPTPTGDDDAEEV